MPNPPITTIIFDMDGVLTDLDDHKRIAFLEARSALTHQELWDTIWTSGFETLSDSGGYNADHYLAEFGRRIGYEITNNEWCEYRRSGMTPMPEILAIAEQLSRTVSVAVLTNNGHQLHRTIDVLFPELRPIFGEHIYVSAQFNARKPNREVYHGLCNQLGVAPERAIMIDDRLENVQGAINAGLHGIHFRNESQLSSDLSHLLLPHQERRL